MPLRLTGPPGAAPQARRLLRFLAARGRAISPLSILTHDFPDPDALASAWCLRHLAGLFGIDSRIVYGGVIARTENRAMVRILRMPIHRCSRADLGRDRPVALVDTQPAFDNNPFPASRRAAIVVDQHRSPEPPAADLAIVDPECGATCVILAQALLLHGAEIPVPLATAIAYGIISDTLDLYRATRRDVVDTYLQVLRRCDMHDLAAIQNPPRSRRFFATLGRGITGAEGYRRVIVSHLGQVAGPEDVAQIADFLLTYERAEWSFCTGRGKGRLYLSLRARTPNGQAGEVLQAVVDRPRSAGGHGAIAGGQIRVGPRATEGTWTALEEEMQGRLARRLRLPARGEFRRLFGRPPRKG
jgi:nanoRNase/pAp phosphatase (c-di-AMP/oligoRNAs hydrolase)